MPLAVFVPAQLNDLAVDVSVGTPARGAVFYRGASRWNALAAGTSGQVLTSGGAGADPSWATPSTGATNLDALSDVNLPTASQGDILYRNATEWVRLVAGTAGQALLTGGAGANPAWGASAADLSPAVILAPTTSARNVIQPTGDFIAAILRGNASQTLDTTQWQLSDATIVGSISSIGAALHRPKDAATATITIAQTLGHQSSGTPANGFGTELRFTAHSTTTIGRDAVGIQALWATAADATRKARGVLNVYDTVVREAMRFESDGSFGLVGFGGPVLTNTHVGICCAAATNKGLVVQGASSQSANLFEAQDNTGSAASRFVLLSTGVPSCPGAGSNSERFGSGSSVSGVNGLAFGNGATSVGTSSLAIGQGANAAQAGAFAIGTQAVANGATNSFAIGILASATGANSFALGPGTSATQTQNLALGVSALTTGTNGANVAIGFTAQATGDFAISLGAGAVAGHQGSIVLGCLSTASTAAAQFVAGGNSAFSAITDVYIGRGVVSASPSATTYNATGGSGTDIAGANLALAGGKGTGAGIGGSIKFQSTIAGASATTLRTLQDKWIMTNVGVWQGWQPSSVQDRQAFDITPTFATATDASRKARAVFNIYDTAAREALRLEASGSAAMIGFLGNAAIARPGAFTLTGSATRTFPTDPSGAYTGIDNLQVGTPYATVADLNTLRGVVSSLLGVVRQIATDLGSTSGYGLLNA